MDIEIQTRNLEISDSIRQHIVAKLGQVERHLPSVTRAVVELTGESTRSQQDRVVAEATLWLSGTVLRAEHRGPDTRAVINSVVEALDRRVSRYKSRVYRSERAKQVVPIRAQQAEELAEPVADANSEVLPEGYLVRRKQFPMEPTSVEDAAWQMQLLGHKFYMFLNEESGQFNVLYLREDGNFGLIEPEV